MRSPRVARADRRALLLVLSALCGCAEKGGDDEPSRRLADASRAPDSVAGWQLVFEDLPGALISVWGTASDDVWTVGSDTRDGKGALILRYDGTSWQRLVTAVEADLWWVFGFEQGPVFAAGSHGTIVRFVGGELERFTTPSRQGTLNGIWGAMPNDVWAVGGDLQTGSGALLWHFDGVTWRPADVDLSSIGALFKVWGTSSRDVWAVGSNGTALHYDGSRWAPADSSTTEPLFTVHGASNGVYTAVGGYDLGVMAELVGSEWHTRPLPEGTRLLFGVWLTTAGGYAVGADATVLRRGVDGWLVEPTGLDTTKTYHSVWVDPDGGVWAAGGDVQVDPLGAGVLAHKGPRVPRTYEETTVSGPPVPPPLDSGTAEPGADARAPDANTADGSGGESRPPEPGIVACGATPCDLSASVCCVDRAATRPSQCVDAASLCPTGFFRLACDEAADCASGETCCLRRFLQGGGVSDVSCRASCVGATLCASINDCPAGKSCATTTIVQSYAACF